MTREAVRRTLAGGETLVLNALWHERSLTTEDALYHTQKSDAEGRAVLSRLVDIGLAKPRGEHNGRTWHLSAAPYRRLGQPAAYIRQRGFEPLQQEQMVLQYVVKHGRITRRETAELCRPSGPQAYRLLDELVGKRLIVRDGQRGRGVGYLRVAK